MGASRSPVERTVTHLRQRMIDDLQLRNFSPRTVEAYVSQVARFARHFGKSPEQLGPEQIRVYQLFLIREKQAAWSTFNQAVCALRFLYRHTLPRDWPVTMIPYGKRPKRLPSVLSLAEVEKLFACSHPYKHRVILTTLYAAGLRLSEALQLTVADVDSQRMLLTVTRGKGNKARLVPLSPRLLEELRSWWQSARPNSLLFPGRSADVPFSGSSVQKTCKQAAREAGIQKPVTPHTLRHSYATALLEAGVDLPTIGRLLGHSCLSSTLVYLHVRRPHLESIPSPLDWLPVEQCPEFFTA